MVDRTCFTLLISCYDFLRAIRALLPLFHVTGVHNLLLVGLENLGRVSCVRADGCAAEASLIIIVHLFLRFHMTNVVVLRVQIVVALVIYHLIRVVEHFSRSRMITLEDHGAARPFFEAYARVLLLLT